VSQDLSRRHFLVSAVAGAASLALAGMPSATAASPLPTPSEVLAGDSGSMTIVNYATYVTDRSKVDASRAEHQVYTDALREHDRLVIGGPCSAMTGGPAASCSFMRWRRNSKPRP
jgi:ABC-type transport system substrate-binding protein